MDSHPTVVRLPCDGRPMAVKRLLMVVPPVAQKNGKNASRISIFFRKLRMAVYPSNKALFGLKFWENAFPNIRLFDAEKFLLAIFSVSNNRFSLILLGF